MTERCHPSGRSQSHAEVHPWPNQFIGDRVRLTDGPLAGVEGTLTSVKGIPSIVVTISLLQRSVAVEVPADSRGRRIPQTCCLSALMTASVQQGSSTNMHTTAHAPVLSPLRPGRAAPPSVSRSASLSSTKRTPSARRLLAVSRSETTLRRCGVEPRSESSPLMTVRQTARPTRADVSSG